MSESLKVEVVGQVMTNTDNPWRTQGDYRQDQRRQTHLYIMQAITLLIAVAGLALSSYFQLQASKEKQTVVVEVVHRHIQEPTVQQPVAVSSPTNSTPEKSALPRTPEPPTTPRPSK